MGTVLFAGGGSGGHLFPGVAVAYELARQDFASRSIFVGSDRAIENHILDQYQLEQVALPFRPSTAFLKSPWSAVVSNYRAYRSARSLIERTSPSVVVGLGGFASVPTVLAAWRSGIPIVLLEQNAVLGRANHWLLRFADRICLSFPDTPLPHRQGLDKAVVTGNPLRREIVDSSKSASRGPDAVPTLLVLGGSQGAVGVNEATVQALANLQDAVRGWRIVHQAGVQQVEWVKQAYAKLDIEPVCDAFFENMDVRYQEADLVISRAGGTTLAELAVHGLPAVLIPYPGSIRNHQQRNAEYYADGSGAVLVEQSGEPAQTADVLAEALSPLLTQPDRRATMHHAMRSLARPEAASLVAEIVQGYLTRSHPLSYEAAQGCVDEAADLKPHLDLAKKTTAK